MRLEVATDFTYWRVNLRQFDSVDGLHPHHGCYSHLQQWENHPS